METPFMRVEQLSADPYNQIRGVGAQPYESYFEMEIVFTDAFPCIELEASDREMIQLAESSGSFAFLNSEEEDIYNDALKKE